MSETEAGRAGDEARGAPAAVPLSRVPSPVPAAKPGQRHGRAIGPWAGLAAGVARALANRRLFVVLPFFAIAGLIAYRTVPYEPDRAALAAVALAALSSLVLARRRLVLLRVLVAFSAFWAGFCLLSLHGALFGAPMLSHPVYGTFGGTVERVLNEGPGGQRIVVSDIVPEAGEDDVSFRKARVYLRETIPFVPGDRIRAAFRFAPVPGPVLPGAYDAQFQSYFAGIGAYAIATSAPDRVAVAGAGWRQAVTRLRRGIGERIDAEMAEPGAGIARALTIGDQSRISDETRSRMAKAGLAHVLAISGLHLSLVAGGVFWFIRAALALSPALGRQFPAKSIAAVGGIAAALVYLTLSGASVSATRATIMLLLVFGAVLFGRQALTMRNVAIAAMLLIVLEPASVFRPSFQLSFAAVTALVGVYEMMRGRSADMQPGPFAHIWRIVAGMALTSLIAGGATALFAAYHFQQTAPLGVVGNVLALPLVGFVVLPFAFLAVLAMPFGVEWPFLAVLGWGIDRILGIAGFVSAWSGQLDVSPLLAPSALIIGLGALGWFAFLQSWHRFAGPVIAVPLVLLFGMDVRPDVLVADSTQAVALKTDAGMALVSGRTGSFAVDVWQETYGVPISQSYRGLRCDSLGCIAKGEGGYTIAIVKKEDAFFEDCWQVDLVVTRLHSPATCKAHTQVVDAGDLSRGGVHWLRWDAQTGEFDIRAAMDDAGRPWRPAP